MPNDDSLGRLTLLRYVDAWKRGDLDALLDSYSDDAVFHYFGTTDLAGDHVGKQAAIAAMATASMRAARELLEVIDVLIGDHLGTVIVREQLSRDGESAHLQRVLVYRIENDKITECWLYDEDQPLVDRFWAP